LKTRAAVLWAVGEQWSVEEIELDPPRAGEVLVELAAAGLCHSDDHVRTGDVPNAVPMVGGHEGAGVVLEVGPGVTTVAPGDHVVLGFIPSCGRCASCSTGHQNLCDYGMWIPAGVQITDKTHRHHARGQDLAVMCLLGCFAERTVVNEASVIKILDHYPLDRACLVGCAVATGFGAATHAADTRPGDTVVIVGIGGIGASAVMGAKMAGAARIVAIDPFEFKRTKAMELGATHTFASMQDAVEPLRELTWGQMARSVIISVGVGSGRIISSAMALLSKGGRCVVMSLNNSKDWEVQMSLLDLTLFEKQLVGSLYGSGNPRAEVPALLRLWDQGLLDLDALVTRTYRLDQVNDGYADMMAGNNIRGVLKLGS
jgi:NDMA-dependent alcohol dehydrogenase